MKRIAAGSSVTRAVRAFRAEGETVGFVPTMGFLHEGHLSLVRRARRETDRVVVSLFVNPMQFGPGEDLAAYPRDPGRDRRLLRAEDVDLVYEPGEGALYPEGFRTHVEVEGLGEALCGRVRPGHFRGVTTVVAKLLNVVEPDRLYLGQKDFQQAVILTRMVRDLDFAVKVIVCRTVREADGLALSSRNTYLTAEDRAFAPALQKSLREVGAGIRDGRIRTSAEAARAVADRLAEGPGTLEYAEILSREDLRPVEPLLGDLVLALAYRLGRARLIDNIFVSVPHSRAPGSRRKTPAGSKGKSRKGSNPRPVEGRAPGVPRQRTGRKA